MTNRCGLSFAVVAAVLLGACQKAPPAQAPAAPSAPAGPVRVVATDYAYSSVPDTVRPGWHDVLVVNHGKQPHMAVFARLDSGKTINDLLAGVKARAPIANWVVEVGGVNAVLPGDSLATAIDMPAGNYVVACFVNDSTGKPHILDGMVGTVVVADAGPPAISEPVASDTVKLTSYTVAFTTPPTVGTAIIRVENTDSTAIDHDLVVLRINDGKTQHDVMAWMARMGGSPPPFTVVGATTGMPPGSHDDVHVAITPGNYLALCMMPDKTGKPHFMHGMVTPFSVKD